MTVAELRLLPATEKLKIIEALWADLAADNDSFESPAWHGEELIKTEAALSSGTVEVIDWQSAKKELRSRFE
jgi:hypothetical protein